MPTHEDDERGTPHTDVGAPGESGEELELHTKVVDDVLGANLHAMDEDRDGVDYQVMGWVSVAQGRSDSPDKLSQADALKGVRFEWI